MAHISVGRIFIIMAVVKCHTQGRKTAEEAQEEKTNGRPSDCGLWAAAGSASQAQPLWPSGEPKRRLSEPWVPCEAQEQMSAHQLCTPSFSAQVILSGSGCVPCSSISQPQNDKVKEFSRLLFCHRLDWAEACPCCLPRNWSSRLEGKLGKRETVRVAST